MGEETTNTGDGVFNDAVSNVSTELDQDNGIDGESGDEARSTTDELIDKIAQKHRVNVDGKEVEVDLDELIKNYQLREVSDRRMQESSRSRKQIEGMLNLLKSDPSKVLSDPRIGIDLNKFAEDVIYKKLQNEMMTPEQREISEYKQKLQVFEAEKKRVEDAANQKAMSERHQSDLQAEASDIKEALENAGLPKNDFTIQTLAGEMAKAYNSGFKNVKAADVIDLAHTKYVKMMRDMHSSSSDDTLMKLLGDEAANKIRNYDMSKFKKANAIPTSKNVRTGTAPRTKKTADRSMTPSQLRAKIEAEFGID